MAKNISRILIIKPSSLGDIFHAFPAVMYLRKKYPNASIDWVVHPAFADILDYFPGGIDRKILFQRKKLAQLTHCLSELHSLAKELRRNRYDLIIDLQGLMRSAMCAILGKGRNTYGFASPKEKIAARLYHNRILPIATAVHAVDKNLSLVSQICNDEFPTNLSELLGPVKSIPQYEQSIDQKLRKFDIVPEDEIIGIVPGARWESKCFPPELFADIINELNKKLPQRFKFVIVGSGQDQAAAAAIDSLVSESNVYSFVGNTTICELPELLKRCKLILSNDSGPIHVAAAMQVPCFVFFGPTNPELTGPYGSMHQIFQAAIPCLTCLKRHCPQEGVIGCHQIDPQIVSDAIIKFVNENKN